MRQLRTLLALAARGAFCRTGATPAPSNWRPVTDSYCDAGLGTSSCIANICSCKQVGAAFSSFFDADDIDVSPGAQSNRRRSSGGRKAQSGWEAEQLARQSASRTQSGNVEPQSGRRRQKGSRRADLSAQMDADDEALTEELQELRSQSTGQGNAQGDDEVAPDAPLQQGLDAAEALGLPDDASAAEVAEAEDHAEAALAGDVSKGSDGAGGSGDDSSEGEDGDDEEDAEENEDLPHAPSSSIGRTAIDKLEDSASDLNEIMRASKKKQRFMLQQKLMSKDSQESLASDLRRPDTGDFRMKIVDVNRTSKGGRAGRIQGCSALVVVGNNNGILGHGTGKATEAKAAVDKATRRAIKRLSYVPRFREHTIYYPTTVLFGKTKLIMYPLASCRGLRCSDLMTSICQLAGIKDIGIKIQGSRNLRNSVMALFKAFDQMQDRVDESSVDATPSPDWPSAAYKAHQKRKLERLQAEIEAFNARREADDLETAELLDMLERIPKYEAAAAE